MGFVKLGSLLLPEIKKSLVTTYWKRFLKSD